MSARLHDAIEEAAEDVAADTGLTIDEIWHDIAAATLEGWPNVEEARNFAWVHGITYPERVMPTPTPKPARTHPCDDPEMLARIQARRAERQPAWAIRRAPAA